MRQVQSRLNGDLSLRKAMRPSYGAGEPSLQRLAKVVRGRLEPEATIEGMRVGASGVARYLDADAAPGTEVLHGSLYQAPPNPLPACRFAHNENRDSPVRRTMEQRHDMQPDQPERLPFALSEIGPIELSARQQGQPFDNLLSAGSMPQLPEQRSDGVGICRFCFTNR